MIEKPPFDPALRVVSPTKDGTAAPVFDPPGLRPIDQHRRFMAVGRAMTALGRLVARYDFPEQLTLVENRPLLLVGNHRSLFDLVATMAIFTRFGVSSHILIRAAYVERGPHGALLRSIGSVPVSSEHRERAEEIAVHHLLEGKVVSVMPEGRLYGPDDWVDGVGPGKVGASRIARAADAVVVPVGFAGTEKVWPKGRPPRIGLRRPVARLRLGAPFDLPGDDHAANTELIMDRLRAVVTQRD